MTANLAHIRNRAAAASRRLRPSARAAALSVVAAGGLVTSAGVALMFIPAGVILAGTLTVVFALAFLDTGAGA